MFLLTIFKNGILIASWICFRFVYFLGWVAS